MKIHNGLRYGGMMGLLPPLAVTHPLGGDMCYGDQLMAVVEHLVLVATVTAMTTTRMIRWDRSILSG